MPRIEPRHQQAADECAAKFNEIIARFSPEEHGIHSVSTSREMNEVLKSLSSVCESARLCWTRGHHLSYLKNIISEPNGVWVLEGGCLPIEVKVTELWIGRSTKENLNSFVLFRSASMEPFGLENNASEESEEVAIVDGELLTLAEYGNGDSDRFETLFSLERAVLRQRYFKPRYYFLAHAFSPVADQSYYGVPVDKMIQNFEWMGSVSTAALTALLEAQN